MIFILNLSFIAEFVGVCHTEYKTGLCLSPDFTTEIERDELMGQRANLVIKKDNQWQLYYDHWCANSLDIELFWGAEYVHEFITQREPTDKTNWLDEVWCEGAVIVDFDNKHLLWFGGEDVLFDLPTREAHASLMKKQWEGWTIQWAENGIFDIGEYLDISNDVFSVKDDNEFYRFWIDLKYPEWNNVLLSIVENKLVKVSQVKGAVEDIEQGLLLLDNLLGLPRYEKLEWIGDEFPSIGIHIDLDNKIFSYWFDDTDNVHEKIQNNCIEWACVNWKSDYKKHLELLENKITLPIKPLVVRQKAYIDFLRGQLTNKAENPALKLAQVLAENGKSVEISHATESFRGSVSNEQNKTHILNNLEQRLPII